MLNWSISISLGTGDKGREWDRIIRQQAKKNRLSIGAYVRLACYEKIKREQEAAGKPVTEAPANGEAHPSVAEAPGGTE